MMSDLLWQKPGVKVDARIQRFLAGDDVMLDREFFLLRHRAPAARTPKACSASASSTPTSSRRCERELDALARRLPQRRFVLDERFEDGHSAIEARLVERLGDAGRKIHTGRSRNDQVLVATRLWLKDAARATLAALPRERATVALARAEAEGDAADARLHAPAARGGVVARHVVGGLGRRLHRRRAARARHARAGSTPIRSAPPPATASTCRWTATTRRTALGFARHAGVADVRAALARQVRDGGARGAGVGAARPAPAGLGPEPVHQRRIRLRRAAGAVHHRQLDHAEQAQSRRDRADARELRRVAAARTEIEQLLSLPSGYHRDLQFTKGAMFHALRPRPAARWRCCRTCCATWSGRPERDARGDRAVDVRHRPGGRSGAPGHAVPRGLPPGRRSGALGRRAIPRPAWPRACRRARAADCALDELQRRLEALR